MLFLSSLAQVVSVSDDVDFSAFSFALAVLALVVASLIIVILTVVSNWKKFQTDDPHYYVFLEQMTSKKWYAKNNIVFSLVTRLLLISIYVGLFSQP